MHSLAWIFLVYYLLPVDIYGHSRKLLLLIVVITILGFEVIRLYKGWLIFGMRHYEGYQIAAYAWATMAAAVALLLFPMHFAVVCLLGMGLIDPMIGEMRGRKPESYPYIPLICWALIAFISLIFLTEYSIITVLILAAIGSAVAVASEFPSLIIDDDFLMVVVPLFALRAVELVAL